MKKVLFIYIFICSFSFGQQVISFNDSNLKTALLGDNQINTNSNSEIEISEANAYSGALYLGSLSISDATGLEYFTQTTELQIQGNSLSGTLDLSQNVGLTDVSCNSNNLTSVLLGSNSNLERLDASNNNLTQIDVSGLSALKYLSVEGNSSLASIDISNNSNLSKFYASDCSLIGGTNAVKTIDFSNNQLITNIKVENCGLTHIDLSDNSSLSTLDCRNNDLTVLDLANGNNANMGSFSANALSATGNSNLSCIQIDTNFDPDNASNIWQKDASASWSDNCQYSVLVNSIDVEGQGGQSTITTVGGTLQMSAAVLPSNATDNTYTWSVSNGTGSATIDVNGMLTAQTDGTVDVVATANDGSGVTGTETITISNQTAGIEEGVLSFSIVPNPTLGKVSIKADFNIISVEVLSVSGEQIAVFDSKEFDISSFNSGVYFVKVVSDKGLKVNRLMKK